MPKTSSKLAYGLRYTYPEKLTITRIGSGRGFVYYDHDGKKITDTATLERIKSLKIPPAYAEVRISPLPNGHLQAIGKDERRRTQYLYHPEWRLIQDANKFHRMLEFGQVLPNVRRTIHADLKLPGTPRQKILAAIVDLLDKTYIRIGSETYAKANKSFGLTTLHNRHATVKGADIHFTFRGKRGIEHSIAIHDKQLAKIIHNCQDLPGYELFEYKDKEGTIHHIESIDVNDYLKSICQNDFTAKDFRTWHATVLALKYLLGCPTDVSKTEIKKNITNAVKEVAAHLGNTPAISRKSYIHPGVLSSYAKKILPELVKKSKKNKFSHLQLKGEEKTTLTFLEKHTT